MALTVGHVLCITAAVLGGLVLILGIIYAYIYFTHIKPRPRRFGEVRFDYEAKDSCKVQVGTEQEKKRIKTHPFFIMNYVSRVRTDNITPSASVSGQQS